MKEKEKLFPFASSLLERYKNDWYSYEHMETTNSFVFDVPKYISEKNTCEMTSSESYLSIINQE